MVMRAAEPMLVDPEDLERAIAIVKAVCASFGVVPAIRVGPYRDPDGQETPVTMIWAELPSEPVGGGLLQLIPALASALRDAHLYLPELPLLVDPVPAW